MTIISQPGKLLKLMLLLISTALSFMPFQYAAAQRKSKPLAKPAAGNIFQIQKPDFKLSPYTGMKREHWVQAAQYLLKGAFSYVHTLNDPMKFPKQPGISYPRNEGQVPTEMLEGLCRTLLMAAPLLRENPGLTINGIKVADYYKHQLELMVNPASPMFVKQRSTNGGPHQNLVEFGALALSFFVAPDVLWEPLSADTKSALAKTMLSYGDGPTVGSNWKFFNIFILSFFKSRGYTVNEKLLVEYLDKTLQHYRGKGWYNDAPAYDYYSMWAFQLYGPLWSQFFGDKYYPQYASSFRQNFTEVYNSYPYLFSKNGEMIMWGRSMSYRFGSIAPFPLMGIQPETSVNYGWIRRIASGTLLQFLQNPELLKDGIPTLGFYGAFEPTVQPYSCRGSVYWMGKAFLGLLAPANSPFWTAKENEGPWATQIKTQKVHHIYIDSAHILITDYANIGASEVRAWCHVKAVNAREPFRASENYNRLSYNSAFPWQADSVKGVVAMNYIFLNKHQEWEPLRLYTFRKFDNGVYYRDAVLETAPKVRMSLADIPLANGILRVDYNRSDTSTQVKLGHYALPSLKKGIKITKRTVQGHAVEIIDNGQYQLATVMVEGWQGIKTYNTQAVHSQAKNSAVTNVLDDFTTSNGHKLYITLMLWKRSGKAWTDDELIPIKILSKQNNNRQIVINITGQGKKTISFAN